MKQRILSGLTLGLLALFSAAAPSEDIAPARVRESDRSFSHPHDLTLSPDKKFLYVADVDHDAVKVLDPFTLKLLGEIGKGELKGPHDVTFDRNGRLLVADTGNNRIAAYAVRGAAATFAEEWRAGLDKPEGVVSGPDGRIYATSASRNTIMVFAGRDAVAKSGPFGGGPNRFRGPHDIALDAQGRFYVADAGNDRVKILNRKLEVIQTLDGAPYHFSGPKYLALDERGWLYVADELNNQVKILDAARRLVAVIGTGEPGTGPGQLNRPEGVEVWQNHLWISDTYNDRILLYRLNR